MIDLTSEFEATTLRINQLFLDIFLQWYLFNTSVEASDRHHKRYLKNQNHAHQQQRSSEQKSRKYSAAPKLGR